MAEDKLVVTFVPPLVALLLNREREKGSPLSEPEVLEIRDNATAIALPEDVAVIMETERGYKDLDADHCWEEWQKVRLGLNSPE